MGDPAGASIVEIALAIPVRAGRILVARRRRGSHLGNTWEFPGGKLEPGEAPAEAAQRELVEETGLRARRLEPLTVLVHDYPDRSLRIHVFVAPEVEGDVRIEPEREWAWKDRESIESLEMPEANAQILKALRWRVP